MAEVATWRMDPEHLESSIQALRDHMDEEGASILLGAGDNWLSLIEVYEQSAQAHEWKEAVEAIGFEGECSTVLSLLDSVKPAPLRVVKDEAVDGIVIYVGEKPVIAIAGAGLTGLPKGLLHLEGAELSEKTLEKAASQAGQHLISLDVGGNEELDSPSPNFVMHFPFLQALVMSDFQALENVTPLVILKELRSLDLSECIELEELGALSKLPTLTCLSLSGCSKLSEVEPLAALPRLSHLDLSDCEILSHIEPISRMGSLVDLDLSGCKSIVDVGALRACKNLESLSLMDCHGVVDALELKGIASLKKLAFPDAEVVANVLMVSATSRQDVSYVEQFKDTWLEAVDTLREPVRFVHNLLPALRLGLPRAWAVDALIELVDRVKRARLQDKGMWKKIYGSLAQLGDPAWRSAMERSLEDLGPGVDVAAILGPALEVISRVEMTGEALVWANGLVDVKLDSLLTSPRAAKVAAIAVRYYARQGRGDALEPWLDNLTRTKEVVARSKPQEAARPSPVPTVSELENDPAALSGMVARIIQKTPESQVVSQLVAALVGLGRQNAQNPALQPFVEFYAGLIRGRPSHPTAELFLQAFLAVVQERPQNPVVEQVLDLVMELSERSPDSPAAERLRAMLDAASELGIVQFARAAMNHPTLRKNATAELDSFIATYDSHRARRTILRGLVQELCDEDIMGNKPKAAVLDRLEKDLI